MKHFFLDTNILLDFLTDRKPYADEAAALFQLAENQAIKIYVAAISFNNIYYIVRRVLSHAKTIELIKGLDALVETVAIDGQIIKKALSSDFKDFEDGIQHFAAESVQEIEAIITRNTKDFKPSALPVFMPETALKFINQ